jgi:hypothetical protein
MPEPDNRSEGRSNVFLAATLETDRGAIAVRIRNIASRGALVEAPGLPSVGAKVKLARGELSSSGTVAWEGGDHAGINFDRPIDAERWVRRVGHAGQRRVDAIVEAIRDRREIPEHLHAGGPPQTLPAISEALDSLCQRLAGRPGMSVELAEMLAKLDAIAGALRGIAGGRTG